MDILGTIGGAFAPAIPAVAPLLSGILIRVIVEAAKKMDSVPMQEGQTGLIRSVAAVLALASAILTAAAGGELAAFDYSGVVSVIVGAVVAFVSGTGFHHIAKDLPAKLTPKR
jgi:hypothetical protein